MQGYILSITGVAMVQIAPQLNLSPLQQGLVVGSALVGGLPGAYFGGFLADKFGRQTLYSLVLGLTIVCSIASFWATNFVALIIARLLIGVAVGADWPVAQSLVGEFIPRKHRGRLCLVQLKTARMPRACRGSQSGFGRSQRRCSDLHCNFGVRSSRAASSGCSAQSRVRSSGGVPAELVVGPNGRRLRSAWHVVASMHPIHQKVSAPCDSARLPTRCHAPCQPCQAGRQAVPP